MPGPSQRQRFAIEWTTAGEVLRAVEPTTAEVTAAAASLSAFYNDPHNRAMLDHATDLSPEDAIEHFETVAAEGGRPFLLERNGVLMGDADLRNVAGQVAEFAILIGNREAQGKGLGGRFTLMVNALAFERLGLERVFVSIIPANAASLRMFEKLGYTPDEGPRARSFAEAEDDITLSLGRERFRELHLAEASGLRFVGRDEAATSSKRPPPP